LLLHCTFNMLASCAEVDHRIDLAIFVLQKSRIKVLESFLGLSSQYH